MHILWVIIIGFIAGIIARLLAPRPTIRPVSFSRRLSASPALSSPLSSGRRSARRHCRRADRFIHLAPAGVGARYPRPRRPTLALDWTNNRRGDLRSTTTARATPPRPGIVSRLSGRRIFRTARLASSAVTDINATTIPIWPSRSSVRPCAAKTASSSVGGSRRTRRKPSLVSHTSLTSHPARHVGHSPIIISDLLHCSKYIVQRTHGIVNSVRGCWFMTRVRFNQRPAISLKRTPPLALEVFGVSTSDTVT